MLTFSGFRGSYLNTRPIGRGFKHLPRDPGIVNAMKQICVIAIFAYFTLLQSNSHCKHSKHIKMYIFLHVLMISPNTMPSAVNFRTSYRRHNATAVRNVFASKSVPKYSSEKNCMEDPSVTNKM